MKGWVKIHRQLLEWEWYDDINTSRLFIHLLLIANHEDKNWRGIEIKRGQRLTSLDKLSKETSLSVSQIRTCLKKLKSTNEVTSKSHSQHTVFTVENYNSYQGDDKQNDKPVTYESQTNDKPVTTNKNVKNENNEKKDKDLLSASADAVSVLTYLNEICGTKYKSTTKSHIENINARLADHSVEDCRLVIDKKFNEWGHDDRMAGYLRPQTLFSAGKFDGYLMAAKTAPKTNKHDLSNITYTSGKF